MAYARKPAARSKKKPAAKKKRKSTGNKMGIVKKTY